MTSPTTKLPPLTRLWKAFLLAQVLLYGALGVWALSHAPKILSTTFAGEPGFTLASPGPQGKATVATIAPASSLAAAGVRVGDQLEFKRAGDRLRIAALDEKIPMLWTPAATGRTQDIEARPVPPSQQAMRTRLLDYIVCWSVGFISMGAGLLIGMQRLESRSMRALAQILLVWNPWLCAFYLPAGTMQSIFSLLNSTYDACSYVCLLYFALTYPGDAPLSAKPWAARVFYTMFACEVLTQGYGIFLGLRWLDATPMLPHDAIVAALSIAIHVTSMGVLWLSWRRSSGLQRGRLAWIGLSIGIAYSYTLENLAIVLGWKYVWLESGDNIIALVGHLCLIYGILRHRILDFAVVMNRALAYTMLSSILLVLFAASEYAVDKLLHFKSRQQDVMIDALVALLIVLVFHRIQEFVNQQVDHTFFRHWHEAAERMQRFVAKSAHYTDPKVLQARFLLAVAEFSGTIGGAFYMRQHSGECLLTHSTLNGALQELPAGHELFEQLRKHPELVRLTECGLGHLGEFAFPMVVRDEPVGVLIVGAKRCGNLYRPDQIEELRSSVHEVGLHLESLRVQALERENAAVKEMQTNTALECLRLKLEMAAILPWALNPGQKLVSDPAGQTPV